MWLEAFRGEGRCCLSLDCLEENGMKRGDGGVYRYAMCGVRKKEKKQITVRTNNLDLKIPRLPEFERLCSGRT